MWLILRQCPMVDVGLKKVTIIFRIILMTKILTWNFLNMEQKC